MTRAGAVRILAGLVLLALVVPSVFPLRPLPPLGPFLDPVHGVWSAARQADRPPAPRVAVAGLEAPVAVRYDDRGVPHIFAASEADAIRALGYVVARDRLFQLELQWRAGAGRVSELLGGVALGLDREARGLGLADAAERQWAGLAPDDRSRRLMDAYADGVNARLAELGRREVPFEYHLLGRRPAPWLARYSLNLLGRMGWTLALSDLEPLKARAAAQVGWAAADALFPVHAPIQEPIVPTSRPAPWAEPLHLPPPGPGRVPPQARAPATREDPRALDALGSNNWAVGPGRSATGHALLAGDQHLEMSLPSLWYEAHLVVADSLDVYGVTLPGAPGIIIGFNRDVAWTFTNTEADVLDRYRETVDDSLRPTRYRVDGAWRPLRLEVSPYHDARGRVLATDTLRYTHRGPLTRQRDGSWSSMRWTVLEAGTELAAFSRAARATTAAGWLDSMAGYRAPAQNMLVADRAGTIAIRSTGRFPLRPGGRGDVELPGDTSASDWSGDWPLARLPRAVNPAQGYLASANQEPLAPEDSAPYLGANWYSPWRALRINALLRTHPRVTVDDMRRFQTDPGSAAVERFLPAFLAAAARYPARDTLVRAARLLAAWDGRYTVDNTGALLYEAAIAELQGLLWDELDPAPALALTAALLDDPANAWWDDRRTEVVEDRDRVLAEALARALARVERDHGSPEAGGWRWDRVRHANIYHMLRIPALSALDLPVQGGQGTLNPSSGSGQFGPSWRMVVELGPEVRGFGIYPGGQSGNPASGRYTDFIPAWVAGRLDTLRFPRTTAALEPHAGARLELAPGRP